MTKVRGIDVAGFAFRSLGTRRAAWHPDADGHDPSRIDLQLPHVGIGQLAASTDDAEDRQHRLASRFIAVPPVPFDDLEERLEGFFVKSALGETSCQAESGVEIARVRGDSLACSRFATDVLTRSGEPQRVANVTSRFIGVGVRPDLADVELDDLRIAGHEGQFGERKMGGSVTFVGFEGLAQLLACTDGLARLQQRVGLCDEVVGWSWNVGVEESLNLAGLERSDELADDLPTMEEFDGRDATDAIT